VKGEPDGKTEFCAKDGLLIKCCELFSFILDWPGSKVFGKGK